MQLINKEEFDKLTNPEKRVAIAKDVIHRIKLEKIIPNNGYFWKNRDRSSTLTPQEFVNASQCEVCAKGSLVCSWIGNFNKVSWEQTLSFSEYVLDDAELSYNQETQPPELVELFGREMLDNLEAAYEEETYSWHYDESQTEEYMVGFEGRNSLQELMQNIIDNNGYLVIPQKITQH